MFCFKTCPPSIWRYWTSVKPPVKVQILAQFRCCMSLSSLYSFLCRKHNRVGWQSCKGCCSFCIILTSCPLPALLIPWHVLVTSHGYWLQIPPATVINSVNKWIMTGRLTGSHNWPWVLLVWPLFGLTKKPFWYHCWKYTRNDGLSACRRGGWCSQHPLLSCKPTLFHPLLFHEYLIREHSLKYLPCKFPDLSLPTMHNIWV